MCLARFRVVLSCHRYDLGTIVSASVGLVVYNRNADNLGDPTLLGSLQ